MRGFLKRFRSGMPVSQVVDTENLNRIANILEDIEGYNGIRIEKPTNAKGCGWKVVLDLTGGAVGDSGFPFGEQWPFGLKIDGAEVTIYGGIYRFASKEINVAAADPITITADGQWIALKITKSGGSKIFDTAAVDPTPYVPADWPSDSDTSIYRSLYQFAYTAAASGPPAVPASCAIMGDAIHAPIDDNVPVDSEQTSTALISKTVERQDNGALRAYGCATAGEGGDIVTGDVLFALRMVSGVPTLVYVKPPVDDDDADSTGGGGGGGSDNLCPWCPRKQDGGVVADPSDGSVSDGSVSGHPGTTASHPGPAGSADGGVRAADTPHGSTCPPCLYGLV